MGIKTESTLGLKWNQREMAWESIAELGIKSKESLGGHPNRTGAKLSAEKAPEQKTEPRFGRYSYKRNSWVGELIALVFIPSFRSSYIGRAVPHVVGGNAIWLVLSLDCELF
ncbi:hypothetical protein EVAR_93046_1 [Eumeta japonica]|uniref:Uncharacterized protein n=1 Tax=Eumeta variegata TaxID=151549 RepID=A0A4C1TIE2_EUMVA|nr:hypothetical protein EVAR_93046_1 [Eumeta japonica]